MKTPDSQAPQTPQAHDADTTPSEDHETPKARTKPRKSPTKSSKEPVVFESREKEASMFKVMGLRSTRNFSTGRLEWKVPPKMVELFERHHFVMNGRIARKP